MKYLKRLLPFALLIGLVFLALYFIPLRREIQISHPCVIWEIEDPTEGELEGMEIKGVYYDYLIRDDKFKGTLRISEVNDHEEILDMTMTFGEWLDVKSASVFYWSSTYKRTIVLGSLYMQDNFERILLFLNGTPQDPGLKDKCVSAPASNLEEAVALAEAMHFA